MNHSSPSTPQTPRVFPHPLPPLPPEPEGRKRPRLATSLALLTGLAAATAVVVSTCTLCYAVSAEGAGLAYVQDRQDYRVAVQKVENQVSQILRTDYAYPAQEATVALTIAPKERVQTPEELKTSLMESVPQVQTLSILLVDGLPVAACPDRETIDQALFQVKRRYSTPATTAAWFANTLTVIQGYLPAGAPLLTAQELADRLTLPRHQFQEAVQTLAETLEPVEGEAVAAADLAAAAQDLPRGEVHAPFLSVRTTQEITYTQPVPYGTREVEDPALLVGERRPLRPGTNGLAECTDRVVTAQGQEISRETMSVNQLLAPVPETVAVGTATGAAGAKTAFQWPFQGGRITSPFGGRYIFGSGSFHRGLDIAAPTGTPISPVYKGTVVWSGPKGTYGNLIQVDHGNGYLSYYAHCSQLLAQVGDVVEPGDTIALVGSTGRSTGPHCHLEILWQGELLDPQACLP